MGWATNRSGQKGALQSNTYWIYGVPGIGKTSLAHSICDKLDEQMQLIGAFFCQRDDTSSSEPRNILPTLIYKLVEVSPPFRKVVAERLRRTPNLTTESMKDTLFLDFICSLPPHLTEHSLVFVIDALDECGDTQSRPDVLKALTDAAALAPWLKIILTSRPEPISNVSFMVSLARRIHHMIWPPTTKPMMTCEPSPEPSSTWWPRTGTSPCLGQRTRTSTILSLVRTVFSSS